MSDRTRCSETRQADREASRYAGRRVCAYPERLRERDGVAVSRRRRLLGSLGSWAHRSLTRRRTPEQEEGRARTTPESQGRSEATILSPAPFIVGAERSG